MKSGYWMIHLVWGLVLTVTCIMSLVGWVGWFKTSMELDRLTYEAADKNQLLEQSVALNRKQQLQMREMNTLIQEAIRRVEEIDRERRKER